MRDVELVGVRPIASHQQPTGKPRLHDMEAGASGGIGVYPDDGADAETLLKNVDMALLQARAHGRAGPVVFKSPYASAVASVT
jgi:predicted signal transduction protein with EAL and GGDEF domain